VKVDVTTSGTRLVYPYNGLTSTYEKTDFSLTAAIITSNSGHVLFAGALNDFLGNS
jgi:hypothetical protein